MKILRLRIPDRSELEFEMPESIPFALWEVVDQPLLFHWFDYAVDLRFDSVHVECPQRLEALISRRLQEATLWPIELSTHASSEPLGLSDFTVDHLPGTEPPTTVLFDEIGWLNWHATLVRDRLDHVWNSLIPRYPYLARGHRSTIHSTAVVAEPYWIGEGVRIEAGVNLGPGACIGDHARIRAGGSVVNSSIAPGIDVPANTHFRNHTVTEGFIFNHRQKILHHQRTSELLQSSQAA
jgi:hypothetical protein